MRVVLPHNQQLLDFIKQHQPIGAARMFATFDGAGENQHAFSQRLNYLKNQGWLVSTGFSTRAVWSLVDEARPMHSAPRRVTTPCPAPDSARRVPPARINIMLGTYQPPAATAQRLGSDDHTRVPSLCDGRRVPFTPGYISLETNHAH